MPLPPKKKWTVPILCTSIGAIAVMLSWLAVSWVSRLGEGDIFFAALLAESPPTPGELADAISRGKFFRFAPILVGFAAFVLATFAATSDHFHENTKRLFVRRYIPVQAFVLLTSALDVVTTIRLVTVHGVDVELHPGIALFCYVFGRAMGVVLGKMLQLLLAEFVAALLGGRRGLILLILYATFCLVAAMWNASQLS